MMNDTFYFRHIYESTQDSRIKQTIKLNPIRSIQKQ